MPRAIVYPHKLKALQERAARRRGDREVYGDQGTTVDDPLAAIPKSADDWAERLAKHVPAEVLPPFLFITSLTDLSTPWRWIFVAFFTIGAAVVDRWNAERVEPPELRPKEWIYSGFAVCAFWAWALGTSPSTRDLLGCSAEVGTAVMVAVAWALGQLDRHLAARFDSASFSG
jgi:hypothetical protein